MSKSIAVISLGAGVGKTTIALNLALALHSLNHKVLLFDADFTKNNLIDHLAIHDIPINIDYVFKGQKSPSDTIYKHFTGLHILPTNIHNYEHFSKFYQLLTPHYDYIILDTPSTPHLSNILSNVDEAIIVHDPKYSSKIVIDLSELLTKMNILNLGVLLNRFSDSSTNALHGNHVLEKIPLSDHIIESRKLKNPVVYTHSKSPITTKFLIVARKLEY